VDRSLETSNEIRRELEELAAMKNLTGFATSEVPTNAAEILAYGRAEVA
jgi:hypothetical protein